MTLKKLSLSIVFILVHFFSAQAQFNWVMIGVNGLTCSACTRTVEMSIRKLNFVENVEMNLENTEGKISFKNNAEVDISQIAKAVVNAGFSVRYLKAAHVFEATPVNDGLCLNLGKNTCLQFVKTKESKLTGEVVLTFLGNQFQTKAEANKNKALLKPICTDNSRKIYFVTP